MTHDVPNPPSRSDLRAEEEEDKIRWCQAVVVTGRMYLNNGDPGYPDEYCDNEAEPDSDYCADHQGADDDPEDIDPDLAYDMYREARDGDRD